MGSNVQIDLKKKTIIIYNQKNLKTLVPYDLVKTMRAGVLAMGPLLAKYNKCETALSGGCSLGVRPINFHLSGFAKKGAKYKIHKGYVVLKAKDGLRSSIYSFPKVTVTGTSNLIMSSVILEGKTVLKNISIEPEVLDLIEFLNKAGAKIKFIGKRSLKIIGVKYLNKVTHRVIGDRIEAFSYCCVAAITNGNLYLQGINPKFLKTEIKILRKIGCRVRLNDKAINILGPKIIKSIKLSTGPYPGFATDNMPMLMAVLCSANGVSKIKETIFENRFMAVPELNRLNASIFVKKNIATIIGKKDLFAAQCISSDLRSTFAIVIGCISAKGVSKIDRIYHGLRGYFNPEIKLRKIGVKINKQR